MNEYILRMDDALRRKYFPDGYFSRNQKVLQSSTRFVYVVFGIIAVIAGLFTALFVFMTVQTVKEGRSASSGIPYVVVSLAVTIFSIGMIVVFVRRRGMNTQKWMEYFSEKSALPIADMQELDRQAGAADSYIIRLAGKGKAVLENIGAGLLTRDYITVRDVIIKRNEVTAAYFYNRVYSMVDKHGVKVTYVLHLAVLSKRGQCIDSEVKREAGEQLISLLRQSSPNMKTRDGETLEEEEFKALCAGAV